jgi:hypothetical protein
MTEANERQLKLARVVLQVVLIEFENIESILNKALRWNAGTDVVWTFSEIKVALSTLLTGGLVAAYTLHAEPPYNTPADPNFATLERYWFLSTDRGKRFLQQRVG